MSYLRLSSFQALLTVSITILAVISPSFRAGPIASANAAAHPDPSSTLEQVPEEPTGYEDLDYWELELALAKEMIALNKAESAAQEPSQHINSIEQQANDEASAQSRESAEPLERLKRQTSVEGRLLAAKYNRNGSQRPRWMRLVQEMRHRRGRHHRFKYSRVSRKQKAM